MAQDWKQLLGDAFNVEVPQPGETITEVDKTASPLEQQGKQRLDIVLDRKGRRGKTATIIAGFVVDDEALASIAADLKRHCGVGGSSRDGEILLQGDQRERALAWLTAHGYKARKI
ncbi:MAG: translation initiation factor [Muribaculaceae bacterium]|nr:translation initiation factor [Muribaculaceae bacterium]